ncbi:two-component system, chemotaxis family, response regulator CheV [Halobacillus alkaliphilus]|uniref:Two-component system, chemotaxis family, response regulator CheV n=1 Tax=Halobacillus alkaliphilus TaxID=396056 RepID=A0A1I2R5I3_9BACI|nr:chemotaxis protein [Halobacillus alkaliphilus]SFG35738.1 two-component system, chemotaxis family, response regulator CheV [Halobacillus alkaliphilus]
MENQQGVLLESGTNELEIVEFGIGSNRFGINVIKVKEILNPQPITHIPHSHPSVEGIIEIRGDVVPVVDTAHALGLDPSAHPAQNKFILAEFNQMKIVFHVHTVTQIHRISWEQMEKPDKMYQGLETKITGIVKMEGGMLLLLDFEKVAADISPESSITKEQLRNLGERERSEKKIMVVEDSSLLRALLQETLEEAGYHQTVVFEDGKEALDHLKQLVGEGKSVEEEYQLVITDIEMPQIDGHHLTKIIKESEELTALPVIIFSSLITNDLRHKGEKVGADAQVSKPEILELVKWIDHYIL